MTTVSLEHVSKKFSQMTANGDMTVAAVNNVTLKINSGDVLVILGPSGCGKSTLLRMIAGLIPPDTGSVLYDNQPLRDIPLKERGIGMVFQDNALIPHWEAGRSVGFFLWLRHREQEVPARVARISQITGFGLDLLLNRRPSQLSGGERQRMAIARALARDPRLFLFDEPFSNLDAKLRGQARVELKRLLQEFPVTSVYVTHDQIEAVSLAHRIAIMREGHLEQVGTYAQLYSNPINLFVATFIGTPTINLFPGHVRANLWQGSYFGGYPIRHDLDDGDPVTLGVRAEYVHLVDEGGVESRIEQVTPYFSERHQQVELRKGKERWTAIAPIDMPLQAGMTVQCALDPEGLLYFNPKTGVRIG